MISPGKMEDCSGKTGEIVCSVCGSADSVEYYHCFTGICDKYICIECSPGYCVMSEDSRKIVCGGCSDAMQACKCGTIYENKLHIYDCEYCSEIYCDTCYYRGDSTAPEPNVRCPNCSAINDNLYRCDCKTIYRDRIYVNSCDNPEEFCDNRFCRKCSDHPEYCQKCSKNLISHGYSKLNIVNSIIRELEQSEISGELEEMMKNLEEYYMYMHPEEIEKSIRLMRKKKHEYAKTIETKKKEEEEFAKMLKNVEDFKAGIIFSGKSVSSADSDSFYFTDEEESSFADSAEESD